MPQSPANTFNCLGKEDAVLSILVGRARPAADGLRHVLHPHGEVKPIQNVMRRTRAGCLTQGSRPFCSIRQKRNRRLRRGSKTAQNAAQLHSLLSASTATLLNS